MKRVAKTIWLGGAGGFACRVALSRLTWQVEPPAPSRQALVIEAARGLIV